MTERKYKGFGDAPSGPSPGSFRSLKAVTPSDTPSTPATSSPSTSSITSTTPSNVPEKATTVNAEITTDKSSSQKLSPGRRAGKKRTGTSTSTSSITNKNEPASRAIAPERDFQRIPNSVTRQAMPSGLFRGKSKQVWDYLWSVSRGAVVPTRTVRKTRREIKIGAGLGSMVTVDAAITHLQEVGLITIRPAVGSLVGNEYEVFSPEEAYTSTSSTSRYTSLTQKLDVLDVLESSISSTTQTIDNSTTYSPPKTSFKTIEFDDDDDAFAGLVRRFKQATKELTNKEPSASDRARWDELADLLIAELRIAATRTSVSSVPAFLTEHLRRRLWKTDRKPLSREEGGAAGDKGELAAEQVASCPDCGGTGFYYPEGFEGGVARCKHARLVQSGDAAQ